MPGVIRFLRARGDAWLPVLLGVLYLVLGFVVGRVRFVYERDPDEGYNLAKVLLVDRGFSLYSEVWSDQPPAFTYLGVVFARVLGAEVENVRLASTLLAAALVFAIADLLRRALPAGRGLVAAGAFALIVPNLGGFGRYSVAAMIGLPAIAWSVLALWALVVSESKRTGLLAASGLLFALSLATKLLCAFLLPLFVVLALYQARSLARPEYHVKRGFLVWGGAFAAGLSLGLGPALAAGGFEQLFLTHVADGFRGDSSLRLLRKYLAPDLFVYVLALGGFLLAIVRREALGCLFGAWALLALVLVGTHDPVWHHHVLLISIPASALAARSLAELAALCLRRSATWQRGLELAALGATLVAIAWPLLEEGAALTAVGVRDARQREIDVAIRTHAPHARSIVTSKQIRAFRLGLVLPPELAVTSSKRYRSGQLSARKIARIVEKQRPDLVIIDTRWPGAVRSALAKAVRRGYRLVYENRAAGELAVYLAEPETER